MILDEVHNYASEEFGKVFKVAGVSKLKDLALNSPPFVLGLTATLERNDGKHSFIEEYCPVFDTVSLDEAKREGYISKFKTYNLGLDFTPEEQEEYNVVDDTFRSAFAKFNHNFDLAMACAKGRDMFSSAEVPVVIRNVDEEGNVTLREELRYLTKTSKDWHLYFAKYNEWDGTEGHIWSPKNVSILAQHFSTSMRKRKLMIYKATVKIDTIEKIANKFPNHKMITFAEDTEFADAVAERLGEDRCKSYHSKTKGTIERVEVIGKKGITYKNKKVGASKHKALIKQWFIEGLFKVFSTVKSLDEGFDDEEVSIGVQASYTSGRRQNTQRNGRNTRLNTNDDNKMALTINLYMKNSQEEKWLKDKQRGTKDVEWIDYVEEINFEDSHSIDAFNLT